MNYFILALGMIAWCAVMGNLWYLLDRIFNGQG
jgi:hypothetical protein